MYVVNYEKPEDNVNATGEMHSVCEFVEWAFKHVCIEIEWTGKSMKTTVEVI